MATKLFYSYIHQNSETQNEYGMADPIGNSYLPENIAIAYWDSLIFDVNHRTIWHHGMPFGNVYPGTAAYGEVFNDIENNIAEGRYSHVEGIHNTASNVADQGHVEGEHNEIKSGKDTHIEGARNESSTEMSHLEGTYNNASSGSHIHIEGTLNQNVSGSYLHVEGEKNILNNVRSSHAEGISNTINSNYSHVEGSNNIVDSDYSHIEGQSNQLYTASEYSHIEGFHNQVSSRSSHAEGEDNLIKEGAHYSHAEGHNTRIYEDALSSHVEGNNTSTYSLFAHAEGDGTRAMATAAHSEGLSTTASGNDSHAEGKETTASGNASHAEGENTTASGVNSHTEGFSTTASGENAHAEGSSTSALGDGSHAEGIHTTAQYAAHAGGFGSEAEGNYSFAHGNIAKANGESSTAFGDDTTADGKGAFVAGNNNVAKGDYSFASGNQTNATGNSSAAFGDDTTAEGQSAFSIGTDTTATGDNSFAGGHQSFTLGNNSIAFGLNSSTQNGVDNSIAVGEYVVTNTKNEASFGQYNYCYANNSMVSSTIFSVGVGGSDTTRKNAFDARLDGTTYYYNTAYGVDHGEIGDYVRNPQYFNIKLSPFVTISYLSRNAVGKWEYTPSNADLATSYPAFGEYFNDYINNHAYGSFSHVEGVSNVSYESAINSHVEGKGNKAFNDSEHVSGQYANTQEGVTLFSVGDGFNDLNRHNAFQINTINAQQNGIAFINDKPIVTSLPDQSNTGSTYIWRGTYEEFTNREQDTNTDANTIYFVKDGDASTRNDIVTKQILDAMKNEIIEEVKSMLANCIFSARGFKSDNGTTVLPGCDTTTYLWTGTLSDFESNIYDKTTGKYKVSENVLKNAAFLITNK